jgi:hypothetical protein
MSQVMFQLDAVEAFNYPLRGRNSFLVAALLIPAAIIGAILTVTVAVAMSGEVSRTVDRDHLAQLVKLAIAAGVAVSLLCAAPCLLLAGFVIRAMRGVARGVSGALPGWESLLSLGLAGLGSCLVALAVGLVPLAVAGLGLGWLVRLTSVANQRQLDAAFAHSLNSGAFFLFFGLLLGSLLLACVVLPMATLRYAMYESVLAALNPLGIARDILRAPGDYVLCLLAPAGLNSVAGSVMAFVPPLMLLYLPFTVYSQLFAANLLGQYWRLHVADA